VDRFSEKHAVGPLTQGILPKQKDDESDSTKRIGHRHSALAAKSATLARAEMHPFHPRCGEFDASRERDFESRRIASHVTSVATAQTI
jgi:hypothetical protein